MCACQPGVNLRDYVSLHPPEVTFFLCFLSLSVSLLCLRFYGQTHTLPNPDTTTDWNRLLSSLSEFQLCAEANGSAVEAASRSPSPPPRDPTAGGPPEDSQLRRRVPLVVGAPGAPGAPLEELSLHAAVTASQLGLSGNASVSVTVHVLSEAEGKGKYTCLTISGPTRLLPLDRLPPECPQTENVLPTVHLVTLTPGERPPTASQSCFSLRSHHDPSLTVMLTREDQAVAGRHLLEASVCLLGLCLLFCLYASRSPRRHPADRHVCTQPLVDPDH